jgi:hypothetical protein
MLSSHSPFRLSLPSFYVKRFNYTTPLQTAVAFFAFAIFADAGLVAPVFEKSYAMFASVWGTWVPLASIFLAAFVAGTLARHEPV